MSSCSTPWRAEYVSWQTAARIPRILFAATEAPTPEPQTRTPRSAPPAWRTLAELARLVGVVDARRRGVRAEVEHLVPERGQLGEQPLAELHASVIERDDDLHGGQVTRPANVESRFRIPSTERPSS